MFIMPVYQCERCNEVILDCDPHNKLEENYYCWECSFKAGIIPQEEYIKYIGISLNNLRAWYNEEEDEIEVTTGKFEHEMTEKRKRNTPKYKQWRSKVFERDNYTCVVCEQVGGKLNAHHIKKWSTHKELRFDIDNGITLCESCHREKHKKGVDYHRRS